MLVKQLRYIFVFSTFVVELGGDGCSLHDALTKNLVHPDVAARFTIKGFLKSYNVEPGYKTLLVEGYIYRYEIYRSAKTVKDYSDVSLKLGDILWSYRLGHVLQPNISEGALRSSMDELTKMKKNWMDSNVVAGLTISSLLKSYGAEAPFKTVLTQSYMFRYKIFKSAKTVKEYDDVDLKLDDLVSIYCLGYVEVLPPPESFINPSSEGMI